MSAALRKPPSYRHHKATGRGVVTLSGKDFYLGKYGAPDSRQAYDRTIAEWLANGRHMTPKAGERSVYVTEVLAGFLQHAERQYLKPDGTHTSELGVFRQIIALVEGLYGSTLATDFGPLALKAVRQAMIDRGWKRTSINKQVNRIKLMFKWATAQEMIPASVYHALASLEGLRRGRGGANESQPKTPVPQPYIDAIRPHVSRQVEALMDLMLATAARAGELVVIRPVDIDTTSDKDPARKLWFYCPADHKTAHHGHQRKIYLNARAQQVIGPFLAGRAPDACLFSPAEAEAERHAEQREERSSPVQPSQVRRAAQSKRRKQERPAGPHYTVPSFRRAIARGCERADKQAHKDNPAVPADQVIIPTWHPHRLRHNAATTIRRDFGLETAKIILGHKSVAVTEIYAEADEAKAQDAMRRIV